MIMTRLKFALAAVALGVCAAPAMAADINEHPSMKDPFVEAPAAPHSWTGIYLGVGGGGSAVNYSGGIPGDILVDAGDPPTVAPFGIFTDADKVGYFGTAQLGYDRQLGNWIVAGIFADYDFNRNTKRTDFNEDVFLAADVAAVDTTFNSELEDSWTIGGRLGFLLNPDTMIYGLAGWTHAKMSVSGLITVFAPGPNDLPFSASDTLNALTVGGGVETMLRDSLSLKIEYRYTDLGALDFVPDVGGAPLDAPVRIDTTVNTVRAVLTWRPDFCHRELF
jgi:outer membrane immunogenic protein